MSFGSPVGERAEETENTLLLLESKRLNIYSKNLNLTQLAKGLFGCLSCTIFVDSIARKNKTELNRWFFFTSVSSLEGEKSYMVAKTIHLFSLYLMPTVVVHLKKHAAKLCSL